MHLLLQCYHAGWLSHLGRVINNTHYDCFLNRNWWQGEVKLPPLVRKVGTEEGKAPISLGLVGFLNRNWQSCKDGLLAQHGNTVAENAWLTTGISWHMPGLAAEGRPALAQGNLSDKLLVCNVSGWREGSLVNIMVKHYQPYKGKFSRSQVWKRKVMNKSHCWELQRLWTQGLTKVFLQLTLTLSLHTGL